MSSRKLIRWSGVATFIAGVLYGIGAILHPVGEDLTAVADPRWIPSHQVYWVSMVLLTFGLVGIYAFMAERSGWLALASFILAFVGTLLAGNIVLLSATVIPIIADQAPEIHEQVLTFPPYLLVVFLVGFGLGYVLLGTEILRGLTLPRWSGLLLILGVTLFLVAEMHLFERQLSYWSVTVGDILFGIGLAWIGYSLWTNAAPTKQSKPT